jgi:hypothetical protein
MTPDGRVSPILHQGEKTTYRVMSKVMDVDLRTGQGLSQV